MKLFMGIFLLTLMSVVGCDVIKNLPTNTTGNLFSLNGTWKLTSNTDGKVMVGSTISVYPLAGNAIVNTIINNNYCIRKGDELWKTVKSNSSGGFTNSVLVNACDETTVYKDGNITVLTNDKISLTTYNTLNKTITQTWVRVK
jgi:hypothetical protein